MTPVRHSIVALLLAVSLPLLTYAQSSTTGSSKVGEVVYFEGSVEVKTTEGTWKTAKIGQPLRRSQQIRTGSAASAEVKWQNGTKSTIGPQATQEVGGLYDKVASQSAQNSDGIVGKFVDLFQGTSTSSSNDVGGIRRASVEMDEHSGPGELYWKTFEEVSFEEAQKEFRNEKYAVAAQKFHLFLQQNADHPNAAKAKLGMGLAYLKLNNPTQARSALESVVTDHPESSLADRARKILDRM